MGFNVGDFVALIAAPELTADGFIVSRHLDGKAGVAVALALAKTVAEDRIVLPHKTTIMVTITEEVGARREPRPAAGRRGTGVGRQRGLRAGGSTPSRTV